MRSLLDILGERASTEPRREAFIFEGEPCTFGELRDDVDRFASFLLANGLERHERVLLALGNSREFFAVFYGVQRAGGVAVPLFPDSGTERLARFAELSGARVLVVPSARQDDPNAGLQVLRFADRPEAARAVDFPTVGRDDIAFLQYTSGSTGEPKGVELRHGNLLANLDHLIGGFRITADDVFVSWLPVHHDMGLILMTMVPFFVGARLILLPTSLAKVAPWLRAIEDYGGTFTAAPDFAYRMLLRYTKEPKHYDLSSLRVALNAAEPVRARTIEDFEASFSLGPVMIAGYGLAEATVGVSSWPPGRAPKVDARGFVSIGKAFPGVETAILADGALGGEPGVEGEIVVQSDATTRGYFRDPEATAALYHGDYLRTGDRGYFDTDGDFFIIGREKNLIIHGGRNLAPGEVEEMVDELAAVRRVAAVGIDRGRLEGEQLYVFAEVRPRTAEEDWPEIVRVIVRRVHDGLGLRPARVYLLRARAIPMTANGKLQHAELRRFYLTGALREEGQILFPDY